MLVPEVLARVGPELGQATATDIKSVHAELEAIIAIAPADMAVHLREIQLPFQQVIDTVASGGGQVEIDTGAVKDALAPLMRACFDRGYRMD